MPQKVLTGILLDERIELTLSDLCHACSRSSAWVVELVEEGVLEPLGDDQSHWRFPGTSLQRARTAMRLQQDLKVNLAGVALALELLEEIDALRERLSRIDVNEIT